MAIRRPHSAGFYYGWVIVAGAWIMYMLNQAAFTWGFTVFVEPLAKEFGWSRTSITIAWALSLTWGLLLGPWFGRSFDRYGSRSLIVVGGLFGGLGWLLIPTADNYWSFAAFHPVGGYRNQRSARTVYRVGRDRAVVQNPPVLGTGRLLH